MSKLIHSAGKEDKSSPLARLMAEIAQLEAEIELADNETPRKLQELRDALQPMVKQMVEHRRRMILLLGAVLYEPTFRRKRRLQSQIAELAFAIADTCLQRHGASLQKELDECGFQRNQSFQDDPSMEPDFEDEEIPRRRRKATPPTTPGATSGDVADLQKKLYHGLARELHPDKTRDDEERLQRTAIMQKLNQAYGNGDLKTLLDILHVHGSVDSKATLDGKTVDSLLVALQQQRNELKRRHKAKMQELPSVPGGWLKLLQDSVAWNRMLRSEKRHAHDEIERLRDISRLLHEPGGLTAFLAATGDRDWSELF